MGRRYRFSSADNGSNDEVRNLDKSITSLWMLVGILWSPESWNGRQEVQAVYEAHCCGIADVPLDSSCNCRVFVYVVHNGNGQWCGRCRWFSMQRLHSSILASNWSSRQPKYLSFCYQWSSFRSTTAGLSLQSIEHIRKNRSPSNDNVSVTCQIHWWPVAILMVLGRKSGSIYWNHPVRNFCSELSGLNATGFINMISAKNEEIRQQ